MFLFRTVGLLAGIAIFRGLSPLGRLSPEPFRRPFQVCPRLPNRDCSSIVLLSPWPCPSFGETCLRRCLWCLVSSWMLLRQDSGPPSRCDSREKVHTPCAWADDATPAASLLLPMPSLGSSQPETLASPRPAMFIPRADSRVCTAWLTCLVRIAHSGLREGKHGGSGGNYRAFTLKASRVGPR